MKIITLSAKKQGGKTTAFSAIKLWAEKQGLSVGELCFAQSLKEVVLDLFVPSHWGMTLADMEQEQVKQLFLPCGKTVRRVLQLVGTDALRGIDPHVWVNAWNNRRAKMNVDILVAHDVRFPNELSCVKALDSISFFLTRNPFDDQHESETALDFIVEATQKQYRKDQPWYVTARASWKERRLRLFKEMKDWNGLKFDHIIDNENLTIEQTKNKIYDILGDSISVGGTSA